MPKVTQEKRSYNAEYWAEYYRKNKAAISSKQSTYYEANKARILAQQKAYKRANKVEIAAKQVARRQANKAQILAQQKAYQRKNKAAISSKQSTYYEANKAQILAQQKAYKRANKVEIAAKQVARRQAHECELCCKKCGRLRPCTDPVTNIDSMACRDCFMKVTGKDIRIEHEWSLYLDEHFFPEWRVCTDSRVGGESCSRYRPDGLWASPKIVLQWELDEKQHRGTSYDCDERRISELYDEFPGKQYVVVRVNPHGYKAPPGTKKPSQEERKALMLRVMHACLEKEWETSIHVVYMFYSADNANITRNIDKSLLFDAKDVDAFCGGHPNL